MQFGVTCGYINDLGYVTHAEKLGFDFAWFPDSPLMRSNIWAMMAIAAQQTTVSYTHLTLPTISSV